MRLGKSSHTRAQDLTERAAAANIARTGRQTIVRFQRSWPWTTDIVIAFQRLRVALPG